MTPQEIEFEYEMAQLDLKAQRYRAAEEKYKGLAVGTNSPEAWCGLGVSKYGLIMEDVGVADVFYCFKKAKFFDETKISDIEIVVINTSIDVVKNLYDVLLLTQQSIDVTRTQRTKSAISALVGTAWTIDSNNKGYKMMTIASAGLTALSFNSYVKAGATITELQAIHKNTLSIIKSIQTELGQYVTKEIALVEKFNEVLKDTHQEVTVNIPVKNEILKLEKKIRNCNRATNVCYFIALFTIIAGAIEGDRNWLSAFFYCLIGYYFKYRSGKLTEKANELRHGIGLN